MRVARSDRRLFQQCKQCANARQPHLLVCGDRHPALLSGAVEPRSSLKATGQSNCRPTILNDEAERAAFIGAIARAEHCFLSAASWVETSIVIGARYGEAGLYHLDHLLARAAVETVTVDAEQAGIARSAYLRYGKGRHPAALNFGDCFSYALSSARGEPLLFKGDDFSKTNVAVVNLGA